MSGTLEKSERRPTFTEIRGSWAGDVVAKHEGCNRCLERVADVDGRPGRRRIPCPDNGATGIHGELFGFIEVEELLFGERSSVVVDPAEERIKGEFAGVKRTFLPLHSVLRIDEVRKHGVSKITALEGGANVAQFPMPLYSTPPDKK